MNGESIKPYVTAVSLIFFFFAVFGYISARQSPEESSQTVKDLASAFGFLKDLNPVLIFLFIFLNNSIKAFLVMLSGFLFGVLPVIFMVSNGYILGVVAAVAQMSSGAERVVLGLLPHGIFELPAVFIASGYGLWLGRKFYRLIRYREPFRQSLKWSLSRFIKIVVPLLLIAALIETFITSEIIKLAQ